MALEAGIYRITNAKFPTAMDLNRGDSENGTLVTAWRSNGGYNQAWLIVPVSKGADTYTIRNVEGGNYISVATRLDGKPVFAWENTGLDNQHWIIRKSGDDWWKIQNKSAGVFLDLYQGSTKDGNKICGWSGRWDEAGNQAWSFQKISVSGPGVRSILQANPYLQQSFKSYLSDCMYLVLPEEKLREIWQNSGLSSRKWRREIFDCDDFSMKPNRLTFYDNIVFKAEIAKWGDDHLKADGFAILCGLMYGSKPGAGHAYNWTILESDLENIVFIEPQDCSFIDKPWGYKAYFGLF